MVEGVGTSNGLGFTADGRHMYHTDTRAEAIYLYDYDPVTGEISNRQVFVQNADDRGRPDGMTVDAENTVWSALWDGGCVVRFAPDGVELERIEFPARKVSCLAFGGKKYRDMYVTTAGGEDREGEGEGAGGLFRVRTGCRGVAEFRTRMGL